jgi:hypothetical protein
MDAMLSETVIVLTVQAMCMTTQILGFMPFVVVLFICVVILDLRLLFDGEDNGKPKRLGVTCLILWAAWLGYLYLLPTVETWRAIIYAPSVLVVTRLSFKHTAKWRIFTLIIVAEALVMQKCSTPEYAVMGQGLLFTAFAHILFFRRIALKELPSLPWIIVSSTWILLIPWFIGLPLAVIMSVVISTAAKPQEEMDVEKGKVTIDANN